MITNLELFATTALIAIGSAALSVLGGMPFGAWLSAQAPRVQRVAGTISVIPFLLPPLLIGLAALPLTTDLQMNSTIGILLILCAHAFMNIGFVGRVVAGSSASREQVESARLDGASDRQILKLIQRPQQLSAVFGAGLLVSLYSATSYGLILLISGGKVRTLETEIADSALQRLDLDQALVLALLQTLLTLGVFLMAKPFGKLGFQLDQIGRSSVKSTLLQKSFSYLYLVSVIFVIGQILLRSLESDIPFGHYLNLGSLGTRSLLNISVLEASLNSVRNLMVVLLVSVCLAFWMAGRTRDSFLVLLPLGISPVVVGLTALVLSGYLPREISSSWVLVPLVQSLIAIPLAYQILRPARRSFDLELRDAAQLDGAGWLARLSRVEVPLLRRPIATALAFTALSSLGEFGAASFLAFGSQETLPIVMFRLASRPGSENFGMAMAAATLYILLTACIVWFISRPSRIQRQADSIDS